MTHTAAMPVEVRQPAPSRRPRRHRAKRPPLLVVIGLCVTVVAAAGYTAWTFLAPEDRGAPLVITEPGELVADQTIERPIEVAADNVTIRAVVLNAGGSAALRIRDGVRGTVIEDTEIRCTTRDTDGIVPGGYTALRVSTYGCREPYAQTPEAPAVIADSRHDGQPYGAEAAPPTAGPTPSGPGGAGFLGAAPSASPSPSASRSAGSGAVTLPSSWPNERNTGVPAGTRLTNSGSLELKKDGQVVSGLNINGCVDVRAKNVTIRKSKINCNRSTYSIRTYDTTVNLVVEDVEINGGGQNSAAVCCGNYTLRRVNIHNVIDGPRLGSRVTIVDSWIHDLARASGSHNDALQTTGASNIVVRHNRLDTYRASTGDPFNACLMVGSTTGPQVSNLTFEDNYCNGGNYSINIRDDTNASNVVFRRNVFGRDFRYGVVARHNHPGVTWESSNVYLDNKQPVVTD
ncbi:right-handed parallel beta-helix repeat-containing protein [Polymorphospora sp. NPDC050346]|uniref:right-handed parallel beta-helix repeat-containing protein n=1 Tax=Polymorphospora sp. NPDC050346 TaxID=3155780 RepID=UPI0033C44785